MSELSYYDVAVIGGGPAGSTAALYSAKLGMKTVMFEKKAYPRDKPCGGALSTRCLEIIGEHAKKSINSLVKTMKLYAPSLRSFTEERESGYFVLRTEFDAAMAKDVENAGAKVLTEALVRSIEKLENGHYKITSTRETIVAKYVVLATGVQNNRLIKQLKIRKRWPKGYLAMTVVSETPVDNEKLKDYEFYGPTLGIFLGIVPRGYGWYFLKDGYINIGIGATWLDIKDKDPKAIYNDFVQLLKDNNFIPKDFELNRSKSHCLVFKKPAKKTIFDKILLVGDSAGFVSPVTGEGLYYAIRSGQLAAEAIFKHMKEGKKLSSYEKAWKKEFKDFLMTTGPFLQKVMYKSLKAMELVVTLGRHDQEMARKITQLIYAKKKYLCLALEMIIRMPITLVKWVF